MHINLAELAQRILTKPSAERSHVEVELCLAELEKVAILVIGMHNSGP